MLAAHTINSLYHQKNDEGEDEKVDEYRYKIAPGKYRSQLFGISQCYMGRNFIGKWYIQVAEIRLKKYAYNRHNKVVYNRVNYFGKGGADDNTYGKVNYIALMAKMRDICRVYFR